MIFMGACKGASLLLISFVSNRLMPIINGDQNSMFKNDNSFDNLQQYNMHNAATSTKDFGNCLFWGLEYTFPPVCMREVAHAPRILVLGSKWR
jgi:hypothetical protein